ncbi:MAG TPA: aminotransferase class V-fold PLP-dependent enzyme [Ktedonobacteraceae bacterium]|jgi:selenocysteine lyase/cysteine desulfurase|nr:aminotransferase class V-fold PLP-dependent enzyme [Ktedonobacteraceae bacterium]
MTDFVKDMPDLDEMLQSLLLVEEGEHEFLPEDEDAQELRNLFFPVTQHCIYLNHAANGALPRPTARVMHDYISDTSDFGNIHYEQWSIYEQGAHRRMAQLISARPDQIAMTASTGDGLTHIASGLHWQAGDNIVTAACEFPSNVYPWLNLHEHGVEVRLVQMRDHRIQLEDVLALIDERTRLVSLSLVEFSTGFRNDIAAIARYCHEHGILCGIDAIQALGVLDINVQSLGVDFLAAASHKWLLSPQTTGILYVADNLLEQLHIAQRGWFSVSNPFDFFNYDQPLKQGAARFEHSTPNRMAIVGLDASLGVFESIDGGMKAVEARALGLTQYAINGLERLGFPVVSPRGANERSSIVCFQMHPEHPEITPEQVVERLEERNIFITSRDTVVRVSPHFYNTIEDIDALLNGLEDMTQVKTV